MICFIKNRSAVRRSRHLSSLIVCHASKPNPCISLQSHSLLLERNRRYCTFPLRGAPLAGGDNSSPSLHTESTSGLSNLIHNPRIGRSHQCMTTSLQFENPMVLRFVFGRSGFFLLAPPVWPHVPWQQGLRILKLRLLSLDMLRRRLPVMAQRRPSYCNWTRRLFKL